jgi:transmembrane sensor
MKEGAAHINESLLIAYINGELSGEVKTAVEGWISASPENQKTFEELEKTWILSGNISPKPVVVNTEDAWLKLKQKITTSESVPEQKQTRVFKMKPWMQVAAAAVVVLGIFGIYRLMNQSGEQITLTAKNEILIDTLQDGSVISLNKNSTLNYPDRFAQNERRVILKGEAFFEVEPDPERPFIIELGYESQVRVLGTSFNIEESDSTTEVFVKTGKVEFKSAASTVILIPGEKGILNHASGKIEKAQPAQLDFNETYWLDQKLDFKKTALKDVVGILSLVFSTSIELENPEAGDCQLTTAFERESLEQILDIIAGSFGLEVMKKNGGYILTGHGC